MRLARQLQSSLISGTASEDSQRGKIRETQVLIGPYQGCSILESHYVPPPPGPILKSRLDSWEKWIHDSEAHPLVKVAVGHYQFEALHPFTDGNGRIGRLLAILQLIESGTLGSPTLNLSPYLETQSDRYRYLLRRVSTHGEWDEWIQFFCHALTNQGHDAEIRIKQLIEWSKQTINDLRGHGIKGVAIAIAEQLIEQPLVTVKAMSDRHGVSNQAANSAINRLVEASVLREVTGRNYSRLFLADAVMAIAFGPTTPNTPGALDRQ